jgi:hypothetical protein
MPIDLERPFFLRDFFFELSKDSESQREHLQLDRELWFRRLELNRKEEILFELEMYLRAIGCFFNLHNQFLADRDAAITRDFTDELQTLAAALERGTALSQLLLDRGLAGTMEFQAFVENQLAPDYLRLQLLRRTLDQRRPEESLFLLNRCFRDLKKITDQLLKRPPCTYQLFYHLGQLTTREIASNRFFNPLLILEFRPEYDRIRSVEILDVLREIAEPAERRAASRVFLALFRLLHYLRYVPRQGTARALRRSLILLHLFHSEASTLAGFLKVLGEKPDSTGLRLAGEARLLGEELRAQVGRVLGTRGAPLDVRRSRLLGDQERTLESGRELLETFLKGCVVRLVRCWAPAVDGERLFDQAAALEQQSRRLRADLWLYQRLLQHALEAAGPSGQGLPPYLDAFSDYFLETSFNFLRYADLGPFERFHAILAAGRRRAAARGPWRARLLEDATRFRDYLAETYDSVCRRAELAPAPLEREALEDGLARWLARA